MSLILIKFIFPFFLSQNHSHKKYTHQMIKICKFAANFTATKCSACGTCTTSYVYCAYKYFIRQHLHTIYTYSSACERGSTDISAIFSLVLNPSWELFFSLLLQNKQSADCLRSCVCIMFGAMVQCNMSDERDFGSVSICTKLNRFSFSLSLISIYTLI